VDKGGRRVGRRRGFSIESLERRELLTAAETFAGPTLAGLIKQADSGKDTEPTIIKKMVTALETQLQSGPLADLTDGAVDPGGFVAEAQSLEISYEQFTDQELSPKFPNLDEVIRLQGESVVASLVAENQEGSIGLLSEASMVSSFQTTIKSLTTGPIQAIGTSTTAMANATKTFRNELNVLSNDLDGGILTLNQVNQTLGAEAEAYRAEVHAGVQVGDLAVSGHADTDINALENTSATIDQTNPSDADTELGKAIKSFVSQTIDTTGLFGPRGGFSKAKKVANIGLRATNHQVSSIVSNVSGTSALDGTATLSATLASFNGSPIIGQPVDFTLDGVIAGVALTNYQGVATLSEISTADAIGTDFNGVVASFASDTNFVSSNGIGNLTVNATATAITNVSGTAVYGGTDTLQATLTDEANSQPLAGQTITFSVDGNTLGTAVTDSNGLATLSGVTSNDAAGTDSGGIVASYAGTSTLASTAADGDLVVSQSGSSLTAVSGVADVGGTATLNATLISSETGQGVAGETVTFTLDGVSVGSATTGTGGIASLTGVTTSDGIGTDTGGVVASFAGDTNFTAAPNGSGDLVVSTNPTVIQNVAGTAAFGGTATLDATLTNATSAADIDGETINFTLDGVSVGSAVTNSSGLASLAGVVTADAVGTDTDGIVATFAGDSSNAAAPSASGNLVVSQAGTTLNNVSGTAALGGTASLTATLSSSVTSDPISGETITFTLDGKSVGTATTNAQGVATLSGVTTTEGAGTDSGGVVATFAGDTDYATTNTTGNLTVANSPSAIGNVSGTASYGGTAILTATFTSSTTSAGLEGQTINFTLDGNSVGTAVTNTSGVATLAAVVTSDAVGTDANGIVASFAGNSNFAAASGTGNLVVSKAGTTLTSVSGTDTTGSTAILVATLDSSVTGSGIANETVTFSLDGTQVGTAVTNSSGVATLSGVATNVAVGTDTGGVTVTFAGDDSYDTSNGTGDLVVTQGSNTTATTLSSVSGTADYSGSATLSATLMSSVANQAVANETVTFSLNDAVVGTAVTNSSGVATLAGVSTSTGVDTYQAVGTDTGGVTVSFAGDSTNGASSGTGNLVVSQAPTSLNNVSGTGVYGGTATLSADLTTSAAGDVGGETVTFSLDGTQVGTAVTNSSGVATLSGVTTTDGVGTDTGGVTVTFAGDDDYVTSNGTGDLVVSQAGTTLTNVSGTSPSGGPATLTAMLMSSVTNLAISGETVNFTLDGTSAGSAVTDSNGIATLTGVPISDSAGTDSGGVVVNYAGNDDYVASQGTGDLVVQGNI
jgi:hypothetical protein